MSKQTYKIRVHNGHVELADHYIRRNRAIMKRFEQANKHLQIVMEREQKQRDWFTNQWNKIKDSDEVARLPKAMIIGMPSYAEFLANRPIGIFIVGSAGDMSGKTAHSLKDMFVNPDKYKHIRLEEIPFDYFAPKWEHLIKESTLDEDLHKLITDINSTKQDETQ